MLKNRFSSTSVTNWGRLNVNNATVTAMATITKTFYKASAIPIIRETAITPTSISSMGSSATLSSSSSLFSLLTLRSLSSSFSSATRCFSLFFVLLLLGILSNEGQMVECASAGAVRPGTGNPSARLPRTSASQLNSGNGTGNNVYKLAAKSSTNSTTRNGNLRTSLISSFIKKHDCARTDGDGCRRRTKIILKSKQLENQELVTPRGSAI
uniref:Uncharacterized protein n=1 Tax=Glossina palpalis gambiensis TaxID=67801 RepID=A0A1B0C1T6_9MUSC